MFKNILFLGLALASVSVSHAATSNPVLGTWHAQVSSSGWGVDEVMVIRRNRIDTTVTCSHYGYSGVMRNSVPITITANTVNFLSAVHDSVDVGGQPCNINQEAGPVSYQVQGNRLYMRANGASAVYERLSTWE